MIELRHLRYFIAVAEELNLSRAAEKLGTSQPSLGQQIRDLESEVGVALFQREKRHLELTSGGVFLLRQAREMMQSWEASLRVLRAIARGEQGTIVLGSSPSSDVKVLPRLLAALHADFPDVEFSVASQGSSLELAQVLLRREVDIAFIRPIHLEDELLSVPVLDEEFLAVVPAGHASAKKEKLALEDVRDLPFLTNPPAQFYPQVSEALNAAGIETLSRRLEWNPGNIIVDLNVIGSGLGFSLLPDYVEKIAPATVAVRRLEGVQLPRAELVAAYRRDNHSPALSFLLSTLRRLFPI